MSQDIRWILVCFRYPLFHVAVITVTLASIPPARQARFPPAFLENYLQMPYNKKNKLGMKNSHMAILPIFCLPEPILRERAQEVTDLNGELQTLIDNMAQTMYQAPGLGLAANQVGVLKRVIVYDVSHQEGKRNLQVIINPCITATEGELVHNEGCLSVTDLTAEVKRHARVLVSGLDRHGKPVQLEGEGLLAVVLQHEVDHLNGILFIDHISRLKRGLYLRKLKKQAQQAAAR